MNTTNLKADEQEQSPRRPSTPARQLVFTDSKSPSHPISPNATATNVAENTMKDDEQDEPIFISSSVTTPSGKSHLFWKGFQQGFNSAYQCSMLKLPILTKF